MTGVRCSLNQVGPRRANVRARGPQGVISPTMSTPNPNRGEYVPAHFDTYVDVNCEPLNAVVADTLIAAEDS